MEKLGAKKEAAILALLSTRSIDEAARMAKISLRTLHRWLTEPAFDAAYRKAKRTVFAQTRARLQQGSGPAATTILKIMLDPAVPAATRLKAADCVLGHAAQAIDTEEIEARLAALEQAAELSRQEP